MATDREGFVSCDECGEVLGYAYPSDICNGCRRLCDEHEYEDQGRFPRDKCPACIEEAEAMYEIAMEFQMDEDRL